MQNQAYAGFLFETLILFFASADSKTKQFFILLQSIETKLIKDVFLECTN